MTSIYENTVCDVTTQNCRHPFVGIPGGRINALFRTKTQPFSNTDWEDLLKRKWNKRSRRPLSQVEWKEKQGKLSMNAAQDCCEFLMGRRCGRRRRLLFRSGYYLTIQPDGSVGGTKQKDSPYGKFAGLHFIIFTLYDKNSFDELFQNSDPPIKKTSFPLTPQPRNIKKKL